MLGELGQDARRGFEQGQVDVFFGIELVETVADVRAGGLANLGGELDPGGSGADDHDIDLAGLALRRLVVGTNTRRQQSSVKAVGVGRRIQ